MGRKKNKKKKNNSIIAKQNSNQQLNKSTEIKSDNKELVSTLTTDKNAVKANSSQDLKIVKKDDSSPSQKNFFIRIIDLIIEKQILSKVFIILFATFVFSFAYKNINEMNRKALSYVGLILCIVVSYVEILGIRDHLWIIEGSIPSSRRWREAFLNPSSIRKYKLRRVIAILFAYIVFCYIYKLRAFEPARDTLSFLGIILMITIVYYEILSIRDQVDLISKSIKSIIEEGKDNLEEKEK